MGLIFVWAGLQHYFTKVQFLSHIKKLSIKILSIFTFHPTRRLFTKAFGCENCSYSMDRTNVISRCLANFVWALSENRLTCPNNKKEARCYVCLIPTWGGWLLQALPLLCHCMTVPDLEALSCHYGNLQTSVDDVSGKTEDPQNSGWTDRGQMERDKRG